MVEFISYNGKYPNLSGGLIIIKVNGKKHELRFCLSSGGNCYIDNNNKEIVTQGDWRINKRMLEFYYPELMPFKKEIEDVINKNIEKGCCGGCL